MSRYLTDTSTLIDFSKGREPVRSRMLGLIAAGDELGVCPVNITEFYAGLPAAQQPTWDAFFASLQYWDITRNAAVQAGVWRYVYARAGIAISTADAMVAAVAYEQRAILITDNQRHYPMPELTLMSLREQTR
jgi:predicted nucleic acid-binding protein